MQTEFPCSGIFPRSGNICTMVRIPWIVSESSVKDGLNVELKFRYPNAK